MSATQTINNDTKHRIVELSNTYFGDVAGVYGINHSIYNSLAEAREALTVLNRELREEYDKYEYPYNKAPYSYYVVNCDTNETII